MSIWVFASENNLKVTTPPVFPPCQNITCQRSSSESWIPPSHKVQGLRLVPSISISASWSLTKSLHFRLVLKTVFVCIPFAFGAPGTAPYSEMCKGSRKPQPVLSRFSQTGVSLEVLDTLGTGHTHTSSPALLCREPTAQIDLWGAWPKLSKQGL